MAKFYDVLEKRRSVRRYKADPVPMNTIQDVLDLCSMGPSAGGIRGWRAVITEKKVVSVDAPVYLVFCVDPERYAKRYGNRGRDLYAMQDATIAAAYAQLAAVELGLATVWIGAFKERKVKEMLNISDDWRVVAVLPLGYAE